jgi:hypothetical protein
MHGLVAKAADILLGLSHIDKRNRSDGLRIPLFGKYFYMVCSEPSFKISNYGSASSAGTLRNLLNLFFKEFLHKYPEFEDKCKNIHPHQFRHTWAEFALRRFEGGVFEAVRHHFRHSFESYMTTNYLFNKMKDEAKRKVEFDFIKEIIGKIATEVTSKTNKECLKNEFYGATAFAIKSALEDEVVTPDKINIALKNILDDCEQIVPHEYGYCLVRKSTKSKSKCFDKLSKLPDLTKAGFPTCSSCVHSIRSVTAHKAAIKQLGITHTEQIKLIEENTQWNTSSSNTALNASIFAVKEARRLLEEMGEDSLI